MKTEIIRAIAAITTEYELKPFNPQRVEMWIDALQNFPHGSVMLSVKNHMRTNHFKPQLADIIAGCAAQLDSAWIGADEAWAMIPKSESETAVLTSEMTEAMVACDPLIAQGDLVAARMAFKDTYLRITTKAKIEGLKPAYFVSLGHCRTSRNSVLSKAVREKKIDLDYAISLNPEFSNEIKRMCGVEVLGISDESRMNREKISERIAGLRMMLK